MTYEQTESAQTISSKFRLSPDPSGLDRAHVQPVDWRSTERTAFVEASSYHAAVKKIAAAVGALEHRSPLAVEERVVQAISTCRRLETRERHPG